VAAPLALVREDDGRARISCAWGASTATLELPLQTVVVKPESNLPLVRAGQKFQLDLVVEGVAPGSIRATGRGGIQLISIERTARGVRLALRAVRVAAGPGVTIDVAAGGRVVPIASIGIPVDDGPGWLGSRRTLVTAAGWIGVTGGRTDGDDVLVGAEAAIDLTRWFSPHVAIWQVRDNGFRPGVQLGTTLKLGGSLRPLFRLGGLFENGTFGGYTGLGLEFQMTSRMALRATLDGLIDMDDSRLHFGLGVVMQP
jgi:hypothetical protein